MIVKNKGEVPILYFTLCIFFENKKSSQKESRSVMSYIKEIFEKEGLKGFFTGTSSSLILIINPIINYVIYEYLKKFFKGNLQIF